jgi:aromatic ring hydroxylase
MLKLNKEHFKKLSQLKSNFYIGGKILRRDDLKLRHSLGHLPQNPCDLLQKLKLIRLVKRCTDCCVQTDSKSNRVKIKRINEQLNPDHHNLHILEKIDEVLLKDFNMFITKAIYTSKILIITTFALKAYDEKFEYDLETRKNLPGTLLA